MNKVVLIGNLTKDPEIRYSQSAEPVAIARYTLAVNRRFKREGDQDVDFISCVSFGKNAEFMEKYFKKGMKAAVTGRISVQTYDDASGQRRWMTDVIVEEVEFTESRSAFEARQSQQAQYDAHYDSMAERYTPPSDPGSMSAGSALGAGSALAAEPTSAPASVPEGFAAITESIDDDDLPF
jgi:single-strand DNA-binding protein